MLGQAGVTRISHTEAAKGEQASGRAEGRVDGWRGRGGSWASQQGAEEVERRPGHRHCKERTKDELEGGHHGSSGIHFGSSGSHFEESKGDGRRSRKNQHPRRERPRPKKILKVLNRSGGGGAAALLAPSSYNPVLNNF